MTFTTEQQRFIKAVIIDTIQPLKNHISKLEKDLRKARSDMNSLKSSVTRLEKRR